MTFASSTAALASKRSPSPTASRLSAARSADFGGDELFGGQGEETFREMRDARFAEVAASTGAIGLASSIEAQLARFLGPEG